MTDTTNTTPTPTSPAANDGAVPAGAASLPCQPRILDAYFATKVVTETPGANGAAATTSARLDRIHEHVIGRVLYVVVHIEQCSPAQAVAGTNVTITIKTNDDRLTGAARATLRITNAARTSDAETYTAPLGNTDALKDKDGNCAYTNLATFADKAIFKLTFRPHARTGFNDWANRIRDASSAPAVGIDVAAVGTTAYFAESGGHEMTLINRKVYEVQHPSNLYNSFGTHNYLNATVLRRIGHIENSATDQVRYYYFNRIDNTHNICDVTHSRVRRRANGRRVATTSANANIPRGSIEQHAAPAGGDAAMNYYYNQGADTTRQTPLTNYFTILTRDTPGQGTDYGIRAYDLASNRADDMVDLVRMPDTLNYNQETGTNRVHAQFEWSGTQRRFANPGCFAGFIGVLVQLDRNDVRCTGMCFADATSYPSVTHPNGDSVDTGYLAAAATEQLKVNAFRDHYYTAIISGTTGWKANLANTTHRTDHNDHLHSGDFDTARVLILNPA